MLERELILYYVVMVSIGIGAGFYALYREKRSRRGSRFK